MYRCTPSQLRQETGADLIEMLRDLRCAGIEAQIANRRAQMK
jgi:hypothetical protein